MKIWSFKNLSLGHGRSHKTFGPDRFSRFDVYWIHLLKGQPHVFGLKISKLTSRQTLYNMSALISPIFIFSIFTELGTYFVILFVNYTFKSWKWLKYFLLLKNVHKTILCKYTNCRKSRNRKKGRHNAKCWCALSEYKKRLLGTFFLSLRLFLTVFNFCYS